MSKLNLNAKRWHPQNKKGFLFGLLGVAIAFGIRFTLQPVLETNLPLFFFQINTIIITFFFGIFPGLFTLMISLPIIAYFFLEPIHSFTAVDSGDIRLVLVYITYTLLTGIIIEWLRRSQYSHRLDLLVSKTLSKQIIEHSKISNSK
jgi:K+-sensing histidine kinase KdpD